MGVGSGFVICCQRFFLVACFFSLVLYLSLYLNLKTFIPLARYFYTAFTGRGIIMELLSFSLSLHRFSEWKAAGFCKKSLSFTTKKNIDL